VVHRGIEYQVVQTANPNGFRWTVQLDSTRARTGTSSSKGNAIFKAVCLINAGVAKDPADKTDYSFEPNIETIVAGIINLPLASVDD
jgi:hypothetical protein